MASKKMKAKGRALIKAQRDTRPPEFDQEDYRLSMMRALNYYNFEVLDEKKKRAWAYAYWKANGLDTKPLDKVHESYFHTVGAVAHLSLSGIQLHEADSIRLDSAYKQLLAVAKGVVDEVEVVDTKAEPKKSIQDYMDEAASFHIGEIEGAIDDLLTKGKTFDVKAYLQGTQVKAPVAKRIGDWFKKKTLEFKAAAEDDKEVIDGYGGKRVLTKLIAFTESIVTDCDTIAQIAKTTRAPRKRKEKPPSVLVAKMKWLKEFAELNLKSIFPEKIIGTDMTMMYDTVKRRLIKYQALDGYELSVKGTAIQNFDPEKSGSKIIRKPDVQLKGIQGLSKRPVSNLFNEIKATASKVNGRTNENLIIIGVY